MRHWHYQLNSVLLTIAWIALTFLLAFGVLSGSVPWALWFLIIFFALLFGTNGAGK